MKALSILFGLVSLFVFTACSQQQQLPASGTYVITEIDGQAVKTANPIRVTYEENRLAGRGPVNSWSVPVAADGRLGMGISTRMAGPPELMQLEDRLLKSLDEATLQSGPGKTLVVSKDGKTAVVLTPASE